MKTPLVAAAIAALAVTIAPRIALAQAPAAPPAGCGPGARFQYICGLKAPEDLVQVPGTSWIVASGLGDGATNPASATPGELALIDSEAHTGAKAAFAAGPARAPYDKCPGPPDPAHFATHGLNILPAGRGKARLFAVGHGAREAIEVFDVATGNRTPPVLTWIGCIPAPPGAFHNSVVALKDGRIIVTDFLHSPATFRDMLTGKTTGAVYVWKPGGALEKLPGTDLAGANGVEVTSDLKYLFVAVTGTSSVMRYELAATDKAPTAIKPGLRTDNLRWGPDGKLLLAGPSTEPCPGGAARCPPAPVVVALDPSTLALTPVLHAAADPAFPSLSSALIVGRTLWLGSPGGDRVAYTQPDR